MAYLIRSMREKDVDGIMEIEKVSFGTHHWTENSFKSEIQNSTGTYYSLIDTDNADKLIGYCGFWIIMDESHVTTIAIHKEYRRKHLGELLLQQIIDHSKDHHAKWITLEVRASNIGAQKLYSKYKFTFCGTRKKYYQDNDEDAMIMWTEDIQTSEYQTMLEGYKAALSTILDKDVIIKI